MQTKTKVLKALEENRLQAISGQALAQRTGVSRSAIWKIIQDLKKEGYDIQSVTGKGYTLSSGSDILSKEAIGHYLPEYAAITEKDIHVYKILESTNITAKKLAIDGAAHGTTVIAESQSAGRGRRGRSFASPAGGGVYMSIILKTDFMMDESILITTAASVAVARAIEKTTGVQAQIKWVNDLYLQDKKICGILTEAVSHVETGAVDHVVVGIGVNVTTKWSGEFSELSQTAGSVFGGAKTLDKQFSRNWLIAEMISQMLTIAGDLKSRSFIQEYRTRSCILGEKILVIKQNETISARALDIDRDGHLIVEYEDGGRDVLCSGEISIRRAV